MARLKLTKFERAVSLYLRQQLGGGAPLDEPWYEEKNHGAQG